MFSSLRNSVRSILIPAGILITLIGIPTVTYWFPGWKALGAASALIGCGLILWFVPRWQVAANKANGIAGKDLADLEDAYRRTLTQVLGGVAVAIGIWFTWNNLVIAQRTLEQSERRATAEMFSRAVEQLSASNADGGPRIEARLGGIFTLKQIGTTNPEYFQPVVSLFNAYLHSNGTVVGSESVNANRPSREDIFATFEALGDSDFLVRSIDEFGQEVIHQPWLMVPKIVIRGRRLNHLAFSTASIPEADFSHSKFEHVSFTYSVLHHAKFEGIKVGGNRLNLDFTYCDLSDASFRGATLSETSFNTTHLENADFEGADLRGTKFNHVDLSRARGLTCMQIKTAVLTNVKLPAYLKECRTGAAPL